MNTLKTVLFNTVRQSHPTGDLYAFKNTCLDLQRLVIEMPASSTKEKLLFYMDACIHIATYFYLEEIKQNIDQMRSIIHRVSVVSCIERYLLYLNDVFIILYRKNRFIKTAGVRQKHH